MTIYTTQNSTNGETLSHTNKKAALRHIRAIRKSGGYALAYIYDNDPALGSFGPRRIDQGTDHAVAVIEGHA